MAALTDFFVASDNEVANAFPGWMQSAPAGQTSLSDNTKPAGLFGQIRQLLRPARAADAFVASPRIDRFAHRCEFKGIDLTQIAILMEVMGIAGFEAAIDELDQPVLFSPNSEDEGLHRLPDSLTQALARIKEDELRPIAARWSQTDDSAVGDPDAFTDILTCLRNLARIAADEGKHVYHRWSL
jgi:hypothetical protein